MSNLGKKPMYLPRLLKTEVQTYQNGKIFWISGPNATIFRYWTQEHQSQNGTSPALNVFLRNSEMHFQKSHLGYAQDFYQVLKTRTMQKTNQWTGLWQGQLQKTILSTISGYKKYLTVRGVGYKFQKKTRYLTLQIGYSHKINILIPSDIQMKLNRKMTAIRFHNPNDAFLHGLLSSIRNAKKPDVYKGKGIRYRKDRVLHKEGKKKKTF